MKHIRTYYIGIIVLLLVLYLHPTLSALLFSYKREQSLTHYISKIKKEKNVDPQEFWKWREEYYPGSITFVRRTGADLPHTIFQSSYITSYEYLIDSSDREKSMSIQKKGDTTEIIFIKPISEMRQANGFFDYKDKDKKLLEGKYWLVRTTIQI